MPEAARPDDDGYIPAAGMHKERSFSQLDTGYRILLRKQPSRPVRVAAPNMSDPFPRIEAIGFANAVDLMISHGTTPLVLAG